MHHVVMAFSKLDAFSKNRSEALKVFERHLDDAPASTTFAMPA